MFVQNASMNPHQATYNSKYTGNLDIQEEYPIKCHRNIGLSAGEQNHQLKFAPKKSGITKSGKYLVEATFLME